MAERHAPATGGARVLEREPRDAPRAGHRDGLECHAGVLAERHAAQTRDLLAERGCLVGSRLELDPRVEILGVLAHDHEVHVGVRGLDAGRGARGSHGGEEVEALPERDVGASEPGSDRRRDGALERDAGAPDGVEDAVGEDAPLGVEDAGAGGLLVPVEGDAGRLEDLARGRGDLGADAIPGDEGDGVAHPGQKRSKRIERFTSWIASVMWMPRGHASVQLNTVRQRNTPVFFERIFRRSFAPRSRES